MHTYHKHTSQYDKYACHHAPTCLACDEPKRAGAMTTLYDLPGHLIRRLNQISTAIFAARMDEAGLDLTPVQYAALAALAEHPGVDQATLAGLIAHDRVTIGGVVDRLEGKGLLSRGISAQDRRARVLELTAAGQQTLARLAPAIAEVQQRTLAGLTPAEAEAFVALLRKTTEAGNEYSRAPLRTGARGED
ncbi:transcriptional regulator, MarR family [Paracoccus denitrificans PD1222]|uniref:Transcriptional regulator, MarR family n=2 Tax=Paracoccaceae TaxID=31989 RepID=A1B7R3_PARDP|nr:transcriptional regulator, MarR family [Paracoccus denitrificans PD1222]